MDHSKKELYTAKRTSNLDVSNAELSEIWSRVKSDSSTENWVTYRVVDSRLVVCGSGCGGFEELLSSLNDDDVYFSCLRALVDDKVKFISIYFVGENVNGIRKGKASLYKDSAFSVIESHCEIAVMDGKNCFTKDFFISEIRRVLKQNSANIVV